MADFIYKKFSIEEYGELEFFFIKEILKEKCETGKLRTLIYIFKRELFNVNHREHSNMLELISIACKNGRLRVAKFLFDKASRDELVYNPETMSVVYRKTMENDHVKAGEWLLENFELVQVDTEQEEIWDSESGSGSD